MFVEAGMLTFPTVEARILFMEYATYFVSGSQYVEDGATVRMAAAPDKRLMKRAVDHGGSWSPRR